MLNQPPTSVTHSKMKRKRDAALPQRIVVEPAGDAAAAAAAGPYAAFFASGFRPGRDAGCSWSVHSSEDKQVLVASTARTARLLVCIFPTASLWECCARLFSLQSRSACPLGACSSVGLLDGAPRLQVITTCAAAAGPRGLRRRLLLARHARPADLQARARPARA